MMDSAVKAMSLPLKALPV